MGQGRKRLLDEAAGVGGIENIVLEARGGDGRGRHEGRSRRPVGSPGRGADLEVEREQSRLAVVGASAVLRLVKEKAEPFFRQWCRPGPRGPAA